MYYNSFCFFININERNIYYVNFTYSKIHPEIGNIEIHKR